MTDSPHRATGRFSSDTKTSRGGLNLKLNEICVVVFDIAPIILKKYYRKAEKTNFSKVNSNIKIRYPIPATGHQVSGFHCFYFNLKTTKNFPSLRFS